MHDHSLHAHGTHNRFTYGILLNTIYIIFEIIYGIKSNSVALIADAFHNAGDVFSLALAWFGIWLSERKAPSRFTFGYKNATILTAFINALLLLVAVGGISWEAIERLRLDQNTIQSVTVIIVASIGVFINSLTAYLFFHDRHNDINIKGAFLHMAIDAAISIGVIVGAILIYYTGWNWLDPIICLIISGIILISTIELLKESFDMILHAVPNRIELKKLKAFLGEYKGIISYHDLHIWPLSTTEVALSAHIIVDDNNFTCSFRRELESLITQKFKIYHITLQIELKNESLDCQTNCHSHIEG